MNPYAEGPFQFLVTPTLVLFGIEVTVKFSPTVFLDTIVHKLNRKETGIIEESSASLRKDQGGIAVRHVAIISNGNVLLVGEDFNTSTQKIYIVNKDSLVLDSHVTIIDPGGTGGKQGIVVDYKDNVFLLNSSQNGSVDAVYIIKYENTDYTQGSLLQLSAEEGSSYLSNEDPTTNHAGRAVAPDGFLYVFAYVAAARIDINNGTTILRSSIDLYRPAIYKIDPDTFQEEWRLGFFDSDIGNGENDPNGYVISTTDHTGSQSTQLNIVQGAVGRVGALDVDENTTSLVAGADGYIYVSVVFDEIDGHEAWCRDADSSLVICGTSNSPEFETFSHYETTSFKRVELWKVDPVTQSVVSVLVLPSAININDPVVSIAAVPPATEVLYVFYREAGSGGNAEYVDKIDLVTFSFVGTVAEATNGDFASLTTRNASVIGLDGHHYDDNESLTFSPFGLRYNWEDANSISNLIGLIGEIPAQLSPETPPPEDPPPEE